jgi:hypothetical protein
MNLEVTASSDHIKTTQKESSLENCTEGDTVKLTTTEKQIMTSLKSPETDFHLFLSVDSMNQGPHFTESTILQVVPLLLRDVSLPTT